MGGQATKTRLSAAKPGAARYERDFALWAFEQAKALREGDVRALDADNIAEELETLGRGEFSKLVSILTVIVTHMLKWDQQPGRRSRSWAITIRTQRRHADRQLRENPSLKPRLREALADAYEVARLQAADETGLPLRQFSPDCPYSWSDVTELPFVFDPDDA